MDDLMRRCHLCDQWIWAGEPYDLDDFGWRHPHDCTPSLPAADPSR